MAMATLAFNQGSSGLETVLQDLNIGGSDVMKTHLQVTNLKRVRESAKARLPSVVHKRRHRKSQKARLRDLNELSEGVLYRAGAFNS